MFPTALKPGAQSGASSKAGANTASSCLDGLWDLLSNSKQLAASQPRALASVFSLLSVLWQSGHNSRKIVDALRAQPGFWKVWPGPLLGYVHDRGVAESLTDALPFLCLTGCSGVASPPRPF